MRAVGLWESAAALGETMFKRIDDRRVQGDSLNFDDKGLVSQGSKTHKFAVTSQYNGSMRLCEVLRSVEAVLSEELHIAQH